MKESTVFRNILVAVLLYAASTQPLWSVGTLHWDYLAKLNTPRRNYLGIQQAVAIAPCKVLVAGGYAGGNSSSYGQPTTSCEIIDVCCGTVTPTGSMNTARSEHILLLTPDSGVVAISGITLITNQGSSSGNHTSSVELYNRATGTWSTIGNLLVARRQAQGVFISSHEILIVGGRNPDLSTIQSSEIFDLSTGTSQFASNYIMPVNMHNIGTSSIGTTVIAGGRNGGTNATRTGRITKYDKATNTFTQIGLLSDSVRSSQIIKLYDGRLLVSGGVLSESPYTATKMIFLENSGSFSRKIDLVTARWGHGIGQYNYDSLIMIGGNVLSSGSVSNSCEWYSLSNNTVSTGPSLPVTLGSFSWASVPTSISSGGTVLQSAVIVIGGVSNSGEFGPATPRDSIYILRSCSNPDSIKSTAGSGSCFNVKLSVGDSSNVCRIPSAIHWNFGDNTTGQSGPWSTTHTYPNAGTYTVKATLVYANCGDSLSIQKSVSVNPGVNIAATPKTFHRCIGDAGIQLHATGGVQYKWTPGKWMNDSTSANPIATPLRDTVFIVRGMTADSCFGYDTVYVQVGGGHANAGSDQAICSSDSADLTVTIPTNLIGSIKWSPSLGLSCDTCAFTRAQPPSSTNYIATVTDTSGCVWRDTVRVAFRVGSTAKILGGPVMQVCSGSDSITLSVTPTTGVRHIRWSPNIGLACDTCLTTKAKPKASLTYTALITDSLGCQHTDTLQVAVSSTSRSIQSNGPQFICFKGDSAVLVLNGKVKAVEWTPPGDVPCATCPVVTVKPPATRYYSFIAVDSAGCTLVDSIKVTVLPKSTVDIAPDTVVCGSTAILLNVYGQYQNIQWSPTNGLSCNNCPTVLVTPTPGKTVTYYVTAHNGNSAFCDSRDSIRVRFAPGVEGQLRDQQICPGDSVTINLRQFGGKVTWTPNNGVSCDTCQTVTFKPTKTTKFVVTGDSSGCVSRDTMSIVVAPTTLSVPAQVTVCAGHQVVLPATTNASDVHWSPVDDLSCSDCPNPVLRATQSRTYHVTAGKGLCALDDSIVVTVKPSAQFTLSPIDTVICSAHSVPITLDVQPAGSVVVWDPNSDLSCYNCQSPTARPSSNNVWYYAHIHSPSGCDTSLTVHIRTVPPPNFSVQASVPRICLGDSLTLRVITSDSASYRWTTSDGSATHVACDTCSQTLAAPTKSVTYVVYGTSGGNCDHVDSVHVDVEPRPIITVTHDTTVCIGGTIQLHASGGDQIHWDPNPALSDASSANPTATVQSTMSFTVHVSQSTSPDCPADSTITISTIPCSVKPVITSSSIADILACDSAITTITVRNEGDVILQLDSVKVLSSQSVDASIADLQSANTNLPQKLAAQGGSLSFPLHCVPRASGSASLTLNLYFADSVRTLTINLESYNDLVELQLPPVYDLHADTTITMNVQASCTRWNELALRDSVIVLLSIDSTALVYESVSRGSALAADWTVSYDAVQSTLGHKRFVLRGNSVLQNNGDWIVPSFRTLLAAQKTAGASVRAEFPSLRIPCADQTSSNSIMTFSSCAFNLRHVEFNATPFGIVDITPNPSARGQVRIRYGIGTPATADVQLFDIAGHAVAHLAGGFHQNGTYELQLATSTLSAGEYVVHLNAQGKVYTKTLVVLP